MKLFLMSLLTLFMSFALAEEGCPNLQGEYVATSCPVKGQAYQTVRIFQPDCRTIGFQNVTYQMDGKVGGSDPVRWEPIGVGKLLEREDKTSAYFKEKFFDQDSLYSYSYKLDKATDVTTLIHVDLIDLLRDSNIFVSYDSMGPGNTWFNLTNCK